MRKKIPDKVATEVMYRSDLQCCVCQKAGDQIHHLDNNNANNNFENLAFLCFAHHNEATITGSLRRKLSKATILRFRDHHYQVIDNNRSSSIRNINSIVTKLTTEQLLQAAKNAIIILELEKIKEAYFDAEWNGREEIVQQLYRYSEHSDNRTAYDVLSFMLQAACQIRAGMPLSLVKEIFNLTIRYFPSSYAKLQKKHDLETGDLCLQIGFNMVYDAAIKLNDLSPAPYGLTLWKHVFKHAKRTSNLKLVNKVLAVYDEIEETLQQPDRNDLKNTLELVSIFREDLESATLAFPLFPKHIKALMIL